MESRTKNSLRNIFWGLINKIINIIFSFIMRSILIFTLGVQYIGLHSLFTSILGVLSLAELGFGNALVYSMYKPAAENDNTVLCELLNYYRKCYKIIGIIILGIGISITPFLRDLIRGEYPPEINIYVLYYIYLFDTVISYCLYVYKGSVLTAYQRNDIKISISSI